MGLCGGPHLQGVEHLREFVPVHRGRQINTGEEGAVATDRRFDSRYPTDGAMIRIAFERHRWSTEDAHIPPKKWPSAWRCSSRSPAFKGQVSLENGYCSDLDGPPRPSSLDTPYQGLGRRFQAASLPPSKTLEDLGGPWTSSLAHIRPILAQTNPDCLGTSRILALRLTAEKPQAGRKLTHIPPSHPPASRLHANTSRIQIRTPPPRCTSPMRAAYEPHLS